MHTQCGSCPKCGAPIWVPSSWMAIVPPPVTYSCACFPQTTYTTTTITTNTSTTLKTTK